MLARTLLHTGTPLGPAKALPVRYGPCRPHRTIFVARLAPEGSGSLQLPNTLVIASPCQPPGVRSASSRFPSGQYQETARTYGASPQRLTIVSTTPTGKVELP
jgi:hypothetical protein